MRNLSFLFLIFLGSCGGGGGGGSSSGPEPIDVTLQGKVFTDNYISGATVFLDENNNLTLDSDETSVITDSSGNFSITFLNNKNGNLVATGGQNLSSSLTLDVMIHRLTDLIPTNTKIISPVTTLEWTYHGNLGHLQESISAVSEILELDSGFPIRDPINQTGYLNENLVEKGAQLAVLYRSYETISETFGLDNSMISFFYTLSGIIHNFRLNNPHIKFNLESIELDGILSQVGVADQSLRSDLETFIGVVLSLMEIKDSENKEVQNSLFSWTIDGFQSELVSLASGALNEAEINSFLTNPINYVALKTGLNTIDVTPALSVNQDIVQLDEDGSTTFNILDNDTYIPQLIDHSVSISDPSNGVVSVVNQSTITYTPNPDFFGIDNMSYNLTQNGTTVSGEINITVVGINDAPTIDYALPISVNENQISVRQFNLTDVDNDVNLSASLSLGGIDANYFYLTKDCSAGGCLAVLNFKNTQDYETKNAFSVNVITTDGITSKTTPVTVNLNNLNDNAPSISQTIFSVQENQLDISNSFFTDPDCPLVFNDTCPASFEGGNPYIYSFTGLDAECIESSNTAIPGRITFKDSCMPNFEAKNTYTFTLAISDGVYVDTENITVNILDVNDPAVLSITSLDLEIMPINATSKVFSLNPQDEDGDTVSTTIIGNPSRGTASLNGNNLTFVTNPALHDPELSESYADSVTLRLNDGTENNDFNVSINFKSDPYYQHQWHLNNRSQNNFATNSGNVSADLNVDSVIASGYDGDGVTIAIIDSGTEIAHEDLAANILVNQSYDFGDGDNDPTPQFNSGDHAHGTAVAGLAAARGWNNIGGRGVAPRANLVAYNLLGGENLVEYQSFTNYIDALGGSDGGANTSVVDIFNMSFGGMGGSAFDTFGLPESILSAYENGTQVLRSGKGALYVKSSGNGWGPSSSSEGYCYSGGVAFTESARDENFSCTIASFDSDNTEPYLITTASLNANDERSSYSTPGTSVWISGYGGEFGVVDPAMLTTDLEGCNRGISTSSVITNDTNCNYTHRMNGTSSAAPILSGAIALILEANPNLTWRDVKHILASTATKIDDGFEKNFLGLNIYQWTQNAAGFEHHPSYGFGKVNIASAIDSAVNYSLGSLGTMASTTGNQTSLNAPFNSYTETIMSGATISIIAPNGKSKIDFVKLSVGFNHPDPEHVMIELLSPDGTRITVLPPFTIKTTNPSGNSFDIGINSFYKENIQGDWTIIMSDLTDDNVGGTLNNWSLKIYGH